MLILCNFVLLSCDSQTKLKGVYHLMPWPNAITENDSKFLIDKNITISVQGQDQGRVQQASVNFLRRLSNRTGVFIDEGFPVTSKKGQIRVAFDEVATLSIETDESYSLEIFNEVVYLNSKTDIGALRGLETLLQLTSHNAENYYFPGVKIKDVPRFVWRGLMIDVARHFQPIEVIKRNLEAMASVKMNVFHWHLSDDQGFRVESKVYPKLNQLGSDGLFYTQEQIKEVVSYASKLGIRVIPEFDVPGHASAILTAYPELSSKKEYSYSIERFSGVFDPTINPTLEFTYTFLKTLFTEMAPLFPDTYFHIGGDENEGKHWNENKNIQSFMVENNLETNHDLQTYFNIKLEKILRKLDKKLMGWDEIMVPNMPTTAVIHSWRGENEGIGKGGSIIKAVKSGYKTVFSNGFYIDRMLPVEHHYSIEPIGDNKLTKEEQARVLGGEATMWSELVTPLTIDSRIWPRTAAIAERLWSSKEVNDVEHMKKRLKVINFRLEEFGLNHLKSRDVILRGMTNNQDITPLIVMSKICEPLKIYQRNKGGIEYKTFSPFTLFADACVVDAEDASGFDHVVNYFVNDPNISNTDKVLSYLDNWAENHVDFLELDENPKINPLKRLSENLSLVALKLSNTIQDKNISSENLKTIRTSIEILSEPFVDIEVVIVTTLSKLTTYCEANYLPN